MKKRIFRIVNISYLIVLLICTFSFAGSPIEYTWYPKQDKYTLYTKEYVNGKEVYCPIVIKFCNEDEWIKICKIFLPEYRPSIVDGLYLKFKNEFGPHYKIYIPYLSKFENLKRYDYIDIDTFGHEIAHVLDGEWHKLHLRK